MKVLLDTNMLGRLANSSDPQQKIAEEAVEGIRRAKDQACLVPQCVYEFWVVSTRPKNQNGLGMTSDEAELAVSTFKVLFPFFDDPPGLFEEWEKLVVRHSVVGKSGHDVRLVAAMKLHGIGRIVTFNTQHFRRFPEIETLSSEDASKLTAPTT